MAPIQAQYAGTAQSFSSVPPLPTGLSINPANGWIYGVCAAPQGLTTHTITVSNPLGSAQTDVQIDVTQAQQVTGIILPCSGDQALDSFARSGDGFAPIDAEYFFGGTLLAAAATPDGRWIFALLTNGQLHHVPRDPLSGYCSAPVELLQLPFASQLALTPDGSYLIVTGTQSVTRYTIQIDGTLCCPAQASGPFNASTATAVTSNRLLVGSFPGQVWCYDIAPVLALRGTATDLGPDMSVVRFVSTVPGTRAMAITSTYSFVTHLLSGALRDLKLSTDVEMAAGAAAVIQTNHHPMGQNLSDGSLGQDQRLRVTDQSLGLVYSVLLNLNGTLVPGGGLTPLAVGGSPSGVLALADGSGFMVLDSTQQELTFHRFTGSQGTYKMRTREAPIGMLELVGTVRYWQADTAFVTSAADSSLLAVQSDPQTGGQLSVSAQGPVATGSHPVDVVLNTGGPYVYTANQTDGTISAFRFDPSTLQLTLIETESLQGGAQPISLAITPGGSHLYALDATGNVITMVIDELDGSLSVVGAEPISGSMAEARLRMDVLARFVFVVQPALGRVTSLRLSLPFGQPSATGVLNSLQQPIDLLPSLDGRFVSILERGQPRVRSYQLGRVSGDLTAPSTALAIGTLPIRLELSDALPWISAGGFQQLMVLDPTASLSRSIQRSHASGALQASSSGETLLFNSTQTLQALSLGAAGLGRIGTSDNGVAPRLSLYSITPGMSSYEESDFTAIGAGPHALATASLGVGL
jgi:6-phosphogluconolactonase (cycloisomerase 2 family)